MRDIEEGFPSDSDSYTEYYDYWSDSDLEDESEAEDEEPAENPSNSDFCTEYYDHWSSSDLKAGSEAEGEEPAEEDGYEPPPGPEDSPDPTAVPQHPSPRPSLVDTDEVQGPDRSASVLSIVSASLVNSDYRPDDNATRMGKVAIIRDIGAVTYVRPSTK
jgi:hypothetical protein